MVARLTPDQKAACSSHVGVTQSFLFLLFSPSHSFYWFRIGQRYSPIFRRISPSLLQIYKTVYINIKKNMLIHAWRISNNVSVKSKLQHAPPGQPPGHLTFLKIIVQIPPYPRQNAVQMPHTSVHSGDQMPPPRGHFTGTKMTERRWKRLQLSNKIFINITKTEKHC